MFDKLVAVSKQLYPTGRAFKMPFASEFEKLTKAIALSEERYYNDAKAILNAILPDNNGFTTDDADDWERRLGMANNPLATLTDRKAAILRKLNAPGANPAKGSREYLEYSLRLANFNVYVHENIPAQSPLAVSGSSYLVPVQYGDDQYGYGMQYGSVHSNKIVNHIDEAKDLNFNLGGTYRLSFFIGGSVLGTSANVPLVRKNEFRELILKIKQVQDIGFLFINYV